MTALGLFRQLFSSPNKATKPRRGGKTTSAIRRNRRIFFEPLEDRRVLATAGALDLSFGIDGTVLTGFEGTASSFPRGMSVVQPDGKFVVVGQAMNANQSDGAFAVARFNPDGSLDASFGVGGRVTTAVGNGNATAAAVAVRPDGRILVVGSTFVSGNFTDFALVQYNSNGTLDPTFGIDGRKTVDYGYLTGGNTSDFVGGLALQPDGKFIVVGATYTSYLSAQQEDFAVMRFEANGALDTTFGTGGKAKFDLRGSSEFAYKVVVRDDGRIVVAGDARAGGGFSEDFALIGLTASGALDPGFGVGGKVITDFGANIRESARTLALLPSGKLVAAGLRSGNDQYASGSDFAMAQYNANGTLDTNFGSGGLVTTNFGTSLEFAQGIVVLADERIVLVGRGGNDSAIARYESNGSLDLSFDTDGQLLLNIGGTDEAVAVATQLDGKTIVAARSDNSFAAARLDASGSLDPTFGSAGKTFASFEIPIKASGSAIAIQSDGKIVSAGTSEAAGQTGIDFALVRYNSDGTLDPSFGTVGKVTTDFGGEDRASSVVVQSDGKIIVGGWTRNTSSYSTSNYGFAMVRYSTDGSLDTSFGTSGKVIKRFDQVVINGFTYTSTEQINGLAVQSDGKLIAVGRYFSTNNNSFPTADIIVARFNANGSIDTTFGSGGRYMLNLGAYETADAVAIQSNGRIVVGGRTGGSDEFSGHFTVMRLLTTGSPDSTFGSGGRVVTAFGFPSAIDDIGLSADGSIFAAGYTIKGFFSTGGTNDFALSKYTSTGALDLTFDTDGKVTTDFGGNDLARGLAVQPDGFLVLAGNNSPNNSLEGRNVALARYQPSGGLDSSFDGDGKVVSIFGDKIVTSDVALQADGKIVIAGTGTLTSSPGTTSIAAQRFFGSNDNDGVSDSIESGATGGDGNGDGTQDSQQDNVTSLPNAVDSAYVTLESDGGTSLVDVQAIATLPEPLPVEAEAPLGLLEFAVTGLTDGQATTVVLYVPTGTLVNQYWKYGAAGWYRFDWDAATGTGAIFEDRNGDGTNDIVLHFVDGQRGDDDGEANGVVVDPGLATLEPQPKLDSITYFNQDAAAERNFTSNHTGQRSLIKRIEVVFDGEVQFDAGQVAAGFAVTTPSGSIVPVTLESSVFSAGKTTFVLKVTAGSFSDGAGLKDGNYRLTIYGSVLNVDADNDDQLGGTRVDDFFRFFGDSDGDRDVDALDYNRFRQAYANTTSNDVLDLLFDFDGDGKTDADSDISQFRLRNGKKLAPSIFTL